jgi:chromate reductase, NAD(P)H dehydrogenase (quinone)
MSKNKIGIIIGTNRTSSFTSKIANYYKQKIEEEGYATELIDLSLLPEDFAFSALYQNSGKNLKFSHFQAKIDACDKLIFLAPEYNGSYPGVLKVFIDGLRHPNSLSGKKVCLVGVSTGMLGNAVGLGHLSDVLSYLNANLLGLRIKLGQVDKHFLDGEFTNEIYQKFVKKQIADFLNF